MPFFDPASYLHANPADLFRSVSIMWNPFMFLFYSSWALPVFFCVSSSKVILNTADRTSGLFLEYDSILFRFGVKKNSILNDPSILNKDVLSRSCLSRKRLKCFPIIKQADSSPIDTPTLFIPFVNSISTIRRDLYFS